MKGFWIFIPWQETPFLALENFSKDFLPPVTLLHLTHYWLYTQAGGGQLAMAPLIYDDTCNYPIDSTE